MSFSSKIYSLILTVILTLGCAVTASAQQSLTLGCDSGLGGLRWEIQNGRYIIGIGNGSDTHWETEFNATSWKWIKNTETSVETLHLLLGSRLYLNQLKEKSDNCYGFFAEGDLIVRMLDMEYKDKIQPLNNESKDEVETSLSVLAGYKFIFSHDKQKGFTLELAAGERFNSGDDFHDYKVESNEGFGMVCLGYTW